MKETDQKLDTRLLQGVIKEGYEKLNPIQKQAIPAILSGRDVLGISPTGSGKTMSFVLPILDIISKLGQPKNRHIQALILSPTRELAIQIHEVIRQFLPYLKEPMKALVVHGGVSINPQMKAMQGVQILTATPGRFLDLLRSNAMKLDTLQILLLDEADKLLNTGFKQEMLEVFSKLPTSRQNLLFSATLNPNLTTLNDILLKNPIVIEIEDIEKEHINIEQIAYQVTEERKGPFLRYLIKSQDMQQVLIFTSSGQKADKVALKLKKNGIDAASIHGKKSQNTRNIALKHFKTGDLRVLVTTDLLSRGIDIEFLPFVINYDLPRSPKDFIHRIGRTGRASNPGKAISILTENELHHFTIIQKKMGTWVTVEQTHEVNLHGF